VAAGRPHTGALRAFARRLRRDDGVGSSTFESDAMNAFRMADDSGWSLRFRKRKGRWVLTERRRWLNWPVLFEWAAVTLVACAILMSGVIIGFYRSRSGFDAQSRAFAEDSVNAIVPAWSSDPLLARGTPDLVASTSDQFHSYVDRLAALGPYQKNVGCQGRAAIEPWAFYSPITARYFCEIQSGRRRAVVALSLSRGWDDWKISSFYVSPP
jgi:hypothetical protein